MKTYNNVNIPASIVMKDKAGNNRILNGKLISVNESYNVCSVNINGRIYNDVDLKNVYLNEAFLDTLKEKGKALWSRIKNVVKTVGGFLLPISEAGKQIASFLNTPINVSMMKLPKSIQFFPSKATEAMAESFGNHTLNSANADPFAEAERNDKITAEKYWKRVMKEYVANESMSISDTVKLVNEKYYVDKFAKSLNEAATVSLKNVGGADYGEYLSYTELVDRVRSEILLQLEPVSEGIDPKSIIIWGAPGIGKTAVLKKACDLVKEYNYNLDMVVMKCASLKRDDFELPDTVKNLVNQKVAISTCKTWLPCYDTAGLTKSQIKKIDDFYNAGAYKIYSRAGLNGEAIETTDVDEMINNAEFNGGIIFFDEFSRLSGDVTDIMMNLMGERIYANMPLASKWLCMGASNRLSDERKSESDDSFRNIWGVAKQDRYKHYTYVPTMEEWLDWARQPGSDGAQHIDEQFCEFIEKIGEKVWYDAIAFGSRPDIEKDIFTAATRNSEEDADLLGSYVESHDSGESKDMHTWTPRTWEQKINAPIKSNLKNELFRNYPELYDSIFVDTVRTKTDEYGDTVTTTAKNIDDAKLKAALMKIDVKDWKAWAKGKQPKADPNKALINANDRLAFVKSWITNVVLPEQFGKESVPAKEWKQFERVQNILSPESIEYIWAKGRLNGVKVCKDDDLTYNTADGYNRTTYSKWKSSQHLIEEVFKQIMDSYTPQQIKADQDKDVKKLLSVKTPKVTAADMNSIKEQYKIEIVDAETGKNITYYPLYEFIDANNEDDIIMAHVILNSKTVQRFLNFAKYACKIAIQTKMDNIAEIAERLIQNALIKNRSKEASDFFTSNKQLSLIAPVASMIETVKERDI